MRFFDALFRKKKGETKYVIDKEDDQSEFLKSDEKMKSQPSKKSNKEAVDCARPAGEKTSESGTKSSPLSTLTV